MNQQVYYVLHVVGVILLTAFTFRAFGAPRPEHRSRTMMLTGIFGVIALIAGFGLLAKLKYDFVSGWVILKLVAWLGLSGLAGLAYRRPEKVGLYSVIACVLIAAAVYAVYYKPF